MNGRTVANDDIIEPNTFIVVRQPETESATISVSGTIPLCSTTIELATYDEISDQDNYIAVPAATDIKLSDLTSALIESGIFAPTTSPLPIAVDSIYVYDNSVIQKNKAPSKSYFYRSTGNVGWYSGKTLANDDVIKAGSAILIRKNPLGLPMRGEVLLNRFILNSYEKIYIGIIDIDNIGGFLRQLSCGNIGRIFLRQRRSICNVCKLCSSCIR